MKPLEKFAKQEGVFLAAHRGASGLMTENTLEAYDKAITSGALMVETDIRLSSDGKAYSFHDDQVCSGEGEQIDLSDKSYEEVKKVLPFEPPTLTEIVSLVRDRAYLMIEIKSNFDVNSPIRSEVIVDEVIAQDYLVNTLFGSFDYSILKHLSSKYENINLAAIRIPGDDTSISELKQSLGIKAFVCSTEECNTNLMADAEMADVVVGVYGINDRQTYDRMISLGIKCVVTDYPGRINQLMAGM